MKCGIDLGGTNIKFGFFNNDNNLVKELSIKTSKIKDEIVSDIIKTIKDNVDPKEVLGYTLALPGAIVDDVVVFAPNTNIVGLNFYKELSSALENSNIVIDNDANMAALAEARLSGINDLLVVTLGTGVGGGIVLNGSVYNKNGYDGEIGHIKVDYSKNAKRCNCGSYGCVQAYASAMTIVYDYNKRHKTNITSKDLFEKALDERDALEDIEYALDMLARMLANITSTLAIKEVRITGGMSLIDDTYYDYLKKCYLKYSIPRLEDINIKRSGLGSTAGIYSAKYIIK